MESYDSVSQDWDDLDFQDKRTIRDRLWEMQGGLCAYCEGSLQGESKSHIEHFHPRRLNKAKTFAWENLSLSCDATGHCGRHKDRPGSNHNPSDLIKPDRDDPDQFLFFASTGEVRAKGAAGTNEERLALQTIQILNLNHVSLRNARRREAEVYLESGILSGLEGFDAEDRKEYLKEEIKSLQGKPFASVVRHLLQINF